MAWFRSQRDRPRKADPWDASELARDSNQDLPCCDDLTPLQTCVEATLGAGPYDIAQNPPLDNHLDLGPLHIPLIAGMELAPMMMPDSNAVVGLRLVIDTSEMQLMVFAAPKGRSIAQESLDEISQSLRDQGASVDQFSGARGREALCQVPMVLADGSRAKMMFRIITVDGPRWLLRAVFRGASAQMLGGAQVFEPVLSGIVVDRGTHPLPAGDALLLTWPQGNEEGS